MASVRGGSIMPTMPSSVRSAGKASALRSVIDAGRASGDSQHPLSVACGVLGAGQPAGFGVPAQRATVLVHPSPRRMRPVMVVVQRNHEPLLRLERDLVSARELRMEIAHVHACFRSQRRQCPQSGHR